MKRKIRRHRAIAAKHPHVSVQQILWGVGFGLIVTYFMVLKSLAWAGDTKEIPGQCAHAHSKKFQLSSRKPASEHSLSLLAAIHPFGTVQHFPLGDESLKLVDDSTFETLGVKPGQYLTSEANFAGDYLAPSFEKSPIYAPPVFEVYHFQFP